MASQTSRLNAYRIMWLFVFFDLPVTTKKEQKIAQKFRKELLEDGFIMLQYSVYIRHCSSSESADVHTNWIKKLIPESGSVSILRVTDKQFGNMETYYGRKKTPPPSGWQQLELF